MSVSVLQEPQGAQSVPAIALVAEHVSVVPGESKEAVTKQTGSGI